MGFLSIICATEEEVMGVSLGDNEEEGLIQKISNGVQLWYDGFQCGGSIEDVDWGSDESRTMTPCLK
jgi:hypothetical protein